MSSLRREPPIADTGRVLVVSPHFDDAVMSCGHLLDAASDAIVVTVFTGQPRRSRKRGTAWDRACGFTADDDVVGQRRDENQRALAELGVEGRDLGLVDGQYRDRRYRAHDIATALARVVADWRPTCVAVPLGIGHRDHLLAGEGALRLRADDGRTWLAYVELPYAWRTPDLVTRRLTQLRRRYGMIPLPMAPEAPAVKAKAMACYSSQLAGLQLGTDLDDIAAAPEQLWSLGDRQHWSRRLLRFGAFELERHGVTIPRRPRRS